MKESYTTKEVFRGDLGAAKLGMKLFYDPRYSENKQISCSTCHMPQFDFTDQKRVAVGAGISDMNSMSNLNLRFKTRFFWDGRAGTLEDQAKGPVENPVEHGSSRTHVAYNLYENYRVEYEAIFGPIGAELGQLLESGRLPPVLRPKAGTPFWMESYNEKKAAWERNYINLPANVRSQLDRMFNNFSIAISAYERGLSATYAPYDRFVERYLASGSLEASFNEGFGWPEAYGLKRFYDAGCAYCHYGKGFNDSKPHFIGLEPTPWSRKQVTGYTASLRNLEKTAPYMHDGRYNTLYDVVGHYNRNYRYAKTKPIDSNGMWSVVAFLKSLNTQAVDLTRQKLIEVNKQRPPKEKQD